MKMKIRRRGFIRLAGKLGALGVLGGSFGVAGNAVAQPAAGSSAQGGIEPNTIKRRGIGLRGYDPDRASPGFTLFAQGSQWTLHWRKPDSNHRSRVTPPSFRRRLMSLA
jgi:hypothetical protein